MFHVYNAFKKMKERNWDCIYLAIDVHGTILKPTHKKDVHFEFYAGAEDALKYLSTRDDLKLIIYTSSHSAYIDSLVEFFVDKHIYFDYVNENPEVETNVLSDFSQKFHFDILLDDKAGFNGDTDWKPLIEAIEKYPIE